MEENNKKIYKIRESTYKWLNNYFINKIEGNLTKEQEIEMIKEVNTKTKKIKELFKKIKNAAEKLFLEKLEAKRKIQLREKSFFATKWKYLNKEDKEWFVELDEATSQRIIRIAMIEEQDAEMPVHFIEKVIKKNKKKINNEFKKKK